MLVRAFSVLFATFFMSFCVLAQSQDSIQLRQKTTEPLAITKVADTVAWVGNKMELDTSTSLMLKNTKPFKPNSTRAVIYSVIFPGLGQIYNRKYWKLPIVYGGLLGLTYAVSWNGKLYGDYTKAYKAIMAPDPLSTSNKEHWIHFLRPGTDVDQLTDSQLSTYKTRFKRQRDYFRRNRDLSIIGIVALYALSMIDAYVDAELYDFDISPDLSLRIEPKIETDAFSQKTFGLQCNIKF
ncbi:MAG: hypothetical protein RL662_1584 [Bacteroidota bacterium]|jgi:hypothetical protein